MTTVWWMSLQRARWRVVALTIGFGLFVFVVGLSYGSIDQNAVRAFVATLPPALRVLSGASDIASPDGYLGSAFVHPVSLSIQGALVISLATTLARDRESGAAELLLSRPLAPWRWLAGHTLAIATALVVVDAGGLTGALAARAAVDDLGTVDAGNLAWAVVQGGMVFAAVAGFALLMSVVTRRAAVAVGVAAGFVVGAYALNYLAQVWSVLRPVGVLSVFHRFDPGQLARTGMVPWTPVVATLGFAVVSTIAAAVVLSRSDLSPR